MKKTKIKFFYRLFIFFSFLSFSSVYSQNPAFDSLANEINRISNFKKNQAIIMLDSLYKMAYYSNSPDSSLLIARFLYEKSKFNYNQTIGDTILIHKIKERMENPAESLFEQALLQSALAICFSGLGEYSEAILLNLQALEKFKQIENNRFTARTLNALGNSCSSIGMHKLADFYCLEALNYISSEYHEYFFIKSNLFGELSFLDNKKVAIDSLLILIDEVIKTNYTEFLPSLYLNVGSYLLHTDTDQALCYFNKMQDLDFESSQITMMLNGNMGFYYAIKKDYEQALNYFRVVQEMTEKNSDFENLALTYNHLSTVFEELNQNDSALFYARKHIEISQKLRSNTVAIETHQKYITTFLEASQKDLVIAEQKIVLRNRQLIIIAVLLFSSILIILLFYQLKLKLNAKLQHEEKISRYEKHQRKIEKEKQKEVLDAKIREITSYSLLVSDKNRLLQLIKELNTQALDSHKENSIKILKKIDEIIVGNLNVDQEWNNFKMHFDKVHPNFFKKLKKKSRELTEENLKVCAYIKMSMTTKQIAQILHIADNSVTISRHRIKKKLNLPEEESLTTYICNL